MKVETHRWPGYLALWTAIGTTLGNEIVRHGFEYVVAPPRPNFPLAPQSMWLLAIVTVACGIWALMTGRPGVVHRLFAAGLAGLGLISAGVAVLTSTSPVPDGAIRGDPVSWLLLGLAAAGTVLAVSTLSGEDLLRQLFIVGVVIAAVSIAAIGLRFVIVPPAAQDPMRTRDGILPAQAIFWNINILGMIMGAVLVLQVSYLRDAWGTLRPPWRWVLLGIGPVTSLILVWASSSRTALLAVIIAMAVAFAVPLTQWRHWSGAGFVAACAAVAVAPIGVALGLGYSLNGRANLWSMVLGEIAVNPLLGRGFGNINGEQHAHNQLLETWLHAGLLGVALLIGLAVVGAVVAVRAARWDHATGIAIVTYSALLWGTEIISPWAVFRSLPLPMMLSVLGVLAAVGLARDRSGRPADVRATPARITT